MKVSHQDKRIWKAKFNRKKPNLSKKQRIMPNLVHCLIKTYLNSVLEESYREYKNNSAKQMDDFNRIIEKAKQIEVQLNDEKKNHKELKMKYNELSSLMDEEKKISSALLKEKDEIKKIFDEKARKLEEEINNQMQGN